MGKKAVGCMVVLVLGCAAAVAGAAAPPPVVPGYNRLRDEAKATPQVLGQVLLGELNCAQCHAAPSAKRILRRGAPDLSDAGARLTPQYIHDYLSNPHAIKAGTAMPDLLHALDTQARSDAVDALTAYLVSLGGPMHPSNEGGDVVEVDQGRKLYMSVGCVACHAPQNGAINKVPSYPLPTNLAEKTTLAKLAAFLMDPLKERPGSRMPSLGLSAEEARSIAVYLLREQMENPAAASKEPAKSPGVLAEYYEQVPPNISIEEVGKLKPKLKGTIHYFGINVSGRRNENFTMKFTAVISVPRTGKYTFSTTSDDGSRVYVDSKLVVDNDGEHAPTQKEGSIDLSEGDHPIVVTYFQAGGPCELKVEWEGPGLQRQEIPAKVLFTTQGRPMTPLNSHNYTADAPKAPKGAALFASMGCASCHQISGVQSQLQSKPLADLNADAPGGCLSPQPAKDAPNYDLDDSQRAALKAALADKATLDKALEPKEQVVHTMAAMNCYACHNREMIGGPTADRQDFFVMTSEFDMGPEGKIPPSLTHVGQKLLAQAMEQIIFEGKLHVRPVMATRMPQWSKQVLGNIVEAFGAADQAAEPPAPKFDPQAAKDGRTLVGTKGLGCVNCHSLNGARSLGMPGPDLGTVSQRIRYGWFHQWLDNPPSLVPGTRMPQFWPGHQVALQDVGGGSEDGQINAIWEYLSLGKSMALPVGLIPTSGYELIPADVPIVHRTFMQDVGPRAIAVGYPEMVHVAFDANGVKLAEAWRGKFFSAAGMWEGRGGNWLGPLGTDILKMPPGPAFAQLEHPDSPWPALEMGRRDEQFRNVGGHFKGYELDKQERPTFHYILNDIDIHEQPLPLLKANGADLRRVFTLQSKKPVSDLYFIAAAGKKIEDKGQGTWLVDDKLTVTLAPIDKLKPAVRDSNGQKQLLVPVTFDNGAASFDVEMSW